MSLSSGSGVLGNRVRIDLRPGRVALERQGGFPRPRVLSRHAIEVESGPAGEPAGEPWRASLNALSAGVREQGAPLGRVQVVLSDHFVRYALIPWSESLVGDIERLSFTRLSLRGVYGHVSDAWDLSLDQQPAGEASFACGVDRALIGGLRDLVSLGGGRLESVTPALADCLNRHRRMLKEPEFCLATAEPGRITLAFRSPAGWQAVRSRRVDGLLPQTLPALLKQETVAGAAPDGGVLYLCTTNLADVPPFSVPGWKLVRVAA